MYKSSRVRAVNAFSQYANDSQVAAWLQVHGDEYLANDDTGVSVFEVKHDSAFAIYADESESQNIWDDLEFSCALSWSATHTSEDNARAAKNKRNSRAKLAATESAEEREARKIKAREYAKAYRLAKKIKGEQHGS